MIEVAAGILADAQGRVLLQQRLPGKHLAGRWEFPGGKLESGESVVQALARELREELGIEVLAATPVLSIPWCYPEKTVHLHALRVTAWRGAPQPREGNPLRWVGVGDMQPADMPPADVPIVAALRLPAHYVISAAALPPAMPEALLQLRLPGAAPAVVRRTAEAWLQAAPGLRGRLLLNHDIELARELGLGVHLKAAQLQDLRERPLPMTAWVGASCHDARELELAAALGVDFATLSPVRATASHPGTAPLGWKRFARLAAGARLPVYALGGVGPADLDRARAAGAHGVAGIRAFARV